MKTGRIVPHENLRISARTIEKQTVHCLQLEFEKLLDILRMKNSSVWTFRACNNCRTRWRLRLFIQSTWHLNKPLTDNLTGERCSSWALFTNLYVCLLGCFCRLFQRLLYRLYRLHWHSQDLRQLKTRFLPHYPNRRENTPLNWIIPKKNSETYPPFLRMMTWAFVCSLCLVLS